MLNRWIARACIGLALLGGGLSASLSWAQTQTELAVSSYVNVTLPTLARMKPWIDKSAADRAKAYATMGINDTTCDAAILESIKAGEHFAEGAGELCLALDAWMQNNDLSTCASVKYSGFYFAHTEPVNATIAKLHKSEGILSVRLQLENAAGCAKKTVRYWGPMALSLSAQLSASVSNSGDLLAPSSGAAVSTREAFDRTLYLCHQAYNADDNNKSAVVDAADDACYAMDHLLEHKVVEACQALDKSLKKVFSMGSSDPLASEAKGLSQRLNERSASLDCGATNAAIKAAEDKIRADLQAAATPPPAPVNPYEKRNAIINAINGEQQAMGHDYDAAKLWFDRGDDYEACGYYQRALHSLRTLESLFSDLNRETGDREYSDKSREMEDEQNALLDDVGDMCVDAENRLY